MQTRHLGHPNPRGGGLLRGRRGVEDYDEERGDGAEEQGNQKPEKAAAILRLCGAGIDQAQSSPSGVIARFGGRVKHAQMVARFCGLRPAGVLGPLRCWQLKVEWRRISVISDR